MLLRMDLDEVAKRLAEAAEQRRAADAGAADAHAHERAAIVAAWRAGMPPSRIAREVDRTTTHVRNLRPDDVPPARLGGGAAPKRRRKPAAR